MPPKGRPENLRKPFTPEEAREIGRAGGLASGRKRKEKKMLAEYYAAFLLQNHKVKAGRKEIEMTPEEIIYKSILGNLLKTGTAASVAQQKLIADEMSAHSDSGALSVKKDSELLMSALGISQKIDQPIEKENEE